MKIAAITFRLHAPWVHSLKEKRSTVKSLIAKLQNRYHVSAAEIDEQDTHQIIVIGVAAIVPHNAMADNLMEEISLFVEEKYVEKSLQDEMSIFSSFKNGQNLDMTDVLMGLTANKIAPIFGISKIVGHKTTYWWKVNEETGMEQLTSAPFKEGWTECFTALFLGNEEMIESNESYFPLTCEYYKTMAGTLLSYYQNTF